MTDAVRQMAYVGETPWHGKGNLLQPDATIEVWQQSAGMDYKVCRSRVRFGNDQIWDERHVLFRSDTKEPLSVVSENYKIVQPVEVLEFFRNLCKDQGFTLETAGTLFNGAKYWALARAPQSVTLPGNDVVNNYVLLATSADGSLATTGMNTTIRVVCNNTLSAAIASGKDAVKIRHKSTFHAAQMQVDMGLLEKTWETFSAHANAFARRKITNREAITILVDAIGDPEKPFRTSADMREQPNHRAMASIFQLFSKDGIGRGIESANGTAWGLLNAATEYYDYQAGRSVDSRLSSSWFGPNAAAKANVYHSVANVALDGGVVLDEILSAVG